MDRLFRSHLAAGDLYRAVRDNLVRIHVGLRAGTGLPNAQRKMRVELTVDHLVRCLDDQFHLVLRQLSKLEIDYRRGLFQNAECANDLSRHYIETYIEMNERTLSLRSPIYVRRHLDLAHRVGLDTCFCALLDSFAH